ETGGRIEPCDAHRVIVIEQSGRLLLIGIVADAGLAGSEPTLRIAVALGRHPTSMEMHDSSHLRLIDLGPVEGVIDAEQMFLRQLVEPLHEDRLIVSHVQRGARAYTCVSPLCCRRHVAMYARAKLSHRHTVVRNS